MHWSPTRDSSACTLSSVLFDAFNFSSHFFVYSFRTAVISSLSDRPRNCACIRLTVSITCWTSRCSLIIRCRLQAILSFS
ncbi:unnamed protein product [Haemonchus placei]|uniref:Uncharacterized protein n=1 Tax=Haemonchus placei TaxID=6290 RepID=A0A3P7XDG3_HAEPC|nr:unnamed protein product [Haemonchus placei]